MITNVERANQFIMSSLNGNCSSIPVVILRFSNSRESSVIKFEESYNFIESIDGSRLSPNDDDIKNFEVKVNHNDERCDITMIRKDSENFKKFSIDLSKASFIGRDLFELRTSSQANTSRGDSTIIGKLNSKVDIMQDSKNLLFAVVFGKNFDDLPYVSCLDIEPRTADEKIFPVINWTVIAREIAENWFDQMTIRTMLKNMNMYVLFKQFEHGKVNRSIITAEEYNDLNTIKNTFYDNYLIETSEEVKKININCTLITKTIPKAGIVSKTTITDHGDSDIFYKIYRSEDEPFTLLVNDNEHIRRIDESRFIISNNDVRQMKKFSENHTISCCDASGLRVRWAMFDDSLNNDAVIYYDMNENYDLANSTHYLRIEIGRDQVVADDIVEYVGLSAEDTIAYHGGVTEFKLDEDTGKIKPVRSQLSACHSPFLSLYNKDKNPWITKIRVNANDEPEDSSEIFEYRFNDDDTLLMRVSEKTIGLNIYSDITVFNGDSAVISSTSSLVGDSTKMVTGSLNGSMIYTIAKSNHGIGNAIDVRDMFESLHIDGNECYKVHLDKRGIAESVEPYNDLVFTRDLFMISHQFSPNTLGVMTEF